MSVKKAVIDIGTNSIKFCLGALGSDGRLEFLADEAVPTRLGEGLYRSGVISEAALERNARAVAELAGRARSAGADQIVVTGTAAVRTAKNTEAFQKRVKELSGLSLRVLSGEDEARLSYQAVLSGLDVPKRGVLMTMDTGGGSTEFVFAENGAVTRRFSVSVGAVVLTEQYGMQNAVSDDVLAGACAAVRSELSAAGVCGPVAMMVGFGGGVTALAAADQRLKKYSSVAVHGSSFSFETAQELLRAFARRSAAERRVFANFPPGRADIVLAGACIVTAAMELAKAESLTVSAWGLRHALLRIQLEGQKG